MAARRRNSIGEQFSARVVRMLESPAYRVLSLSAHRLLSRIEVELAHHGGKDNGKLPVTFKDLEDYGIERHCIAPAMREAVALGFIEITEQGRAGNAQYRAPNYFRLTYLHASRCNPTHEWQRIETIEAATVLARAARKNKTPVRKKTHFGAQNSHRKPKSPVRKTPTTGQGGESRTTSIFGGGDSQALTNDTGRSAPAPTTRLAKRAHQGAVASEPPIRMITVSAELVASRLVRRNGRHG